MNDLQKDFRSKVFVTDEVDREHVGLAGDPPPVKAEVDGKWRPDVPVTPHSCPAAAKDGKPNLYGQCFSYPCSNLHKENGIELADCHCPALKVVDPKRTFATQAGLCHDKACSEIPVGGPFQLPKDFCEK